MTSRPGPDLASACAADDAWRAAVRRLQWHLYLRDLEPCRPQVLAYCRTLTRDPEEASDLAQEALLRGFRFVGQLCKSLDRPLPFLCQTARRLWIDRKRRATRAEAWRQSQVIDNRSDASAACEVQQSLELLDGALPPREREVFLLREVWGYTGPEIAAPLGTSPAAAKMAASRARRRLKRRPWNQR
ncbi:MAG: RNA polymerase sigma factor [Pseudomonadota bacterium]